MQRGADESQGEIHCWRIHLPAATDSARIYASLLDRADLRAASRFCFASDRRRYVVLHALARAILASYLHRDPRRLHFQRGAAGKPALRSGSLPFSVAHRGGFALLAIASRAEIGVDVEALNPAAAAEIAGMLPPPLQHRLLGLPPALRARIFFRAWTRLEAYSKACGRGIAETLESFPDFFAASPVERRGWWFHDLPVPPGYVATLAAPAPKLRFSIFDCPGEYRRPEENTEYVNYRPDIAFDRHGRNPALP